MEMPSVRYAYACEVCDLITVVDQASDESYESSIDCPNGHVGAARDASDRGIKTCTAAGCSNYLKVVIGFTDCEGRRGSGECGKALIELTTDAVADLPDPVVAEGEKTKAQRQLDAILQRAEKYIGGSGSHHRSKGGAHTSTARETHSAAASAKKQDRDWYVEQIEALMEKVDSKSQKRGKDMIQRLKAK